MRDQQQDRSDTDDEERDTVMQMDTDHDESLASVQSQTSNQPRGGRSPSPERGSYDSAMASLARLSQLQAQMDSISTAKTDEAPPMRDKTLEGNTNNDALPQNSVPR